jgi:hypothetical protein
MSKIPQLKIIIDTSNTIFSGTDNEVNITFRKYICTDPNDIKMLEFKFKLNPDNNDISSGSTKTYIFKDINLKDESYVKKFTIEKKFDFIGYPSQIPIGFRYSDDWKLKRVRIYYNNKLVVDTNPTNTENKSIWLDKNNYWFTYPDPNTEIVGPGGICGEIKNIKKPSNSNLLFSSIGVL